MSISTISRLFYKKIRMVLAFSFICSGLLAVVLFLLFPTKYQSSTTIHISNKSFESGVELTYSDMLASRSLVENYAEITKSELFAEYIIVKTGISEVSPDMLSSMIQTNVLKNSNVLEMKIEYTDKDFAKVIAEAFPEVLNENFSEIFGSRHVTIINKAHDAKPMLSGKFLALLIFFMISIIASTGILLLVQRGNQIIRTPEDVEKYLGVTVAGTIPDFRL